MQSSSPSLIFSFLILPEPLLIIILSWRWFVKYSCLMSHSFYDKFTPSSTCAFTNFKNEGLFSTIFIWIMSSVSFLFNSLTLFYNFSNKWFNITSSLDLSLSWSTGKLAQRLEFIKAMSLSYAAYLSSRSISFLHIYA